MRALRRFGAPTGDLTEGHLASPGIVYQIGVVPSRIDILTAIDGVAFDEAWPGRIAASVAGRLVPVVGREALLRDKLASGRKKDLADAAWLEEPDPDPDERLIPTSGRVPQRRGSHARR
jgi:hypothetical protein